ncbi:hypothetical protein SNEBB_011286 [Seison nebaliae]|nr:hypothetical protein SNEBB_011286 [Seison nebaliae]
MEQFTNHIQLGYHLIIFYSPTCIHCRRILLIANEFTKVMEHVMKKLFDENLLLIFLNSRKYGMIDGAMAIMIMNQIVKEVPVLTKRMMEKDSHNFYPSILKWKLYDRSIIEHLLNENRQVSLSQFDYNVKLMKEKGKKWINDIQLINLIGSHTYSLRFVNCKEAHDVCNHNKIPSYPTIRFYANGMHIQQYEDQSRTMNDLLRWFLIQVQEQIIMSMKKSSYNVDQSPYDDIDEKDWEVNENDERESSIDGNNWFSENRMKNNLAQFISSELVDDMDQSPTIFHGSEILNFETVLPALSSDDGNEEGDLTVDDRIVNLTEMLELFSFPDLMTTKAKRIFNFFSKVQFAERVKEGIVSRYKLITIDQNGLSKNEFYSIISFMMGTWYSMQNNDVNVKKHIVLLIHTHNQQLGNHGDEWKSLKSLIDQYMTRWSSILSDYNSFDRNGIINLEIDCGHSEKLCKHLMGDEDKEQIIVMSLHENMFYVQSYEGVFSLFDVWRFIDIHFEYLWKDWASSNLETFKYLLHVNLLLKSKEMSLNFYETEESLIEVLKELIEWYWLNVKENPHKRINLIYEDFFTFVTNRLDWTNVETTKRKLTANLQNLILSEIPLAFTYYFLKDDN